MDDLRDARSLLMAGAKYGDPAKLGRALEELGQGEDVSQALIAAAAKGHEGCVKMLLARADAKAGLMKALESATHEGHAGCVNALLAPLKAPGVGSALSLAVWRGREDLVEALLEFSTLNERRRAIAVGAPEFHEGCVKMIALEMNSRGEPVGEKAASAARSQRREDVAAWLEALDRSLADRLALSEVAGSSGLIRKSSP